MEEENEERESLLIQGGKTALQGGLWGLEKYGQVIDAANEQVSLRTIQEAMNPIPGLNQALTSREPEWLTNIMDYSYKDARDDISSGVGWLTEKATGSEVAGDVAEFGTQVILPDITDVKAGGLPIGAIPRVAQKLRKVDLKLGNAIIDDILGKGIKESMELSPSYAGKTNKGKWFKEVQEKNALENSMMMSESLGGGKPTKLNKGWSYVPPTKDEIYKTVQKGMGSGYIDATGEIDVYKIWERKDLLAKTEKGAKAASEFGRKQAKLVQGVPWNTRKWNSIKKELQNEFTNLYGDTMSRIKIGNRSMQVKDVEIEHLLTLQQSTAAFHKTKWGGPIWNDIQKQILSRGLSTADSTNNLKAVPKHIHQIKTNYFNELSGKNGRNFFTDDVIKAMVKDPKVRTEVIDKWLDEVEYGKKIIEDGIEVFETLYKPGTIMPEDLVARLAKIDVNQHSAPELKTLIEGITVVALEENLLLKQKGWRNINKTVFNNMKTRTQSKLGKTKKLVKGEKKLTNELEKAQYKQLNIFYEHPDGEELIRKILGY